MSENNQASNSILRIPSAFVPGLPSDETPTASPKSTQDLLQLIADVEYFDDIAAVGISASDLLALLKEVVERRQASVLVV